MTGMEGRMPWTQGGEDDGTPRLAAGEELTLTIEDLAYGGRGVARVARRVVFVEGGLPGERLRARVVRARPAYAEAAALEILTASRDRATPPCEHYGVCGGCDLQHLNPEAQARAKRDQVVALLARIAGIHGAPVSQTVRGGEAWGYRFRMDFDWTADGPRRGPALGLHRRGRPDEIVPIRYCHLMSEAANAIVAFLSAEAAARRLAPWEP
ncbi:MAG TPA: TRAM domain-containing protein, partial [Candidatus Polarisedimenticolia bacterium]|nr:TRAM domain-containing protein [Candidatus Polarisedimenticolia bacterium]